MNDEIIIDSLRSSVGHIDKQRDILTSLWNESSPRIKKALENYKFVMDRIGKEPLNDLLFVSEFLHNCYQNALFVADVSGSRKIEDFNTDRRLFVCWHFYEYPLLCRNLLNRSVLTMIARDSAVFNPWRGQSLTVNFLDREINSRLAHWLKRGKPIICMFDFCYPLSRSLRSPIFGIPTRTPVGLLKLCRKFGYSIEIVAPRVTSICSIKTVQTSLDLQDLVDAINESLEREILARPTEWLMWQGLAERWD